MFELLQRLLSYYFKGFQGPFSSVFLLRQREPRAAHLGGFCGLDALALREPPVAQQPLLRSPREPFEPQVGGADHLGQLAEHQGGLPGPRGLSGIGRLLDLDLMSVVLYYYYFICIYIYYYLLYYYHYYDLSSALKVGLLNTT